MLWEHEPQASASTASSSSPKHSRVFLRFDRNRENMVSIPCRNTAKALVNFDHQNLNSLCLRHHNVNSSCSLLVLVLFLSSYRNTVLNQSARVLFSNEAY